jgi:uncharacterized membrane protein
VSAILAHAAANEFVSPNLHVVLVHAPLGLLITGLLVELFSFLGWRRGGFRAAGRWMILLGALTLAPTALSGLYALHDVVVDRPPDEGAAAVSWNEAFAASRLSKDPQAWEHMTDHAWFEGIASVGLLLVVMLWLGCTDRWREKLHVPLLVLLVVGCAIMVVAAYHAGEAVYRHGVAVEVNSAESLAAHPEPPSTQPNSTSATTTPSAGTTSEVGGTRELAAHVHRYLPPTQIHVISAGFAVALAVAALGLSMRASHASTKVQGVDDIAAALGGSVDEAYLTPGQRAKVVNSTAVVPPARFWMLVFLVALLTALGGLYLLAGPAGANNWDPKYLVKLVFDSEDSGKYWPLNRRSAHVVAGTGIIVFALLLAMVGRWAPRRKGVLLIFALLFLASAALQVWLGALLLFDGMGNELTHFKP